MNIGAKLVKIVLATINVIVLIASFSIVVYCIWMAKSKDSLSKVLNTVNIPLIELPDIVGSILNLIIAGFTLMMLISFCGGFGAIWEKKVLLKTYGATLVILLILQLVALLMYLFARNKIMELFDNAIFHFVATVYGTGVSEDLGLSALWDAVQVGFQCCGFHSSADFAGTLPLTCCKPNTGTPVEDLFSLSVLNPVDTLIDCVSSPTTTNSNSGIACKSFVNDFLFKISNIIIGVVVALCLVEGLLVGGTVLLVKKI